MNGAAILKNDSATVVLTLSRLRNDSKQGSPRIDIYGPLGQQRSFGSPVLRRQNCHARRRSKGAPVRADRGVGYQ